jgi:hypothetical protein
MMFNFDKKMLLLCIDFTNLIKWEVLYISIKLKTVDQNQWYHRREKSK